MSHTVKMPAGCPCYITLYFYLQISRCLVLMVLRTVSACNRYNTLHSSSRAPSLPSSLHAESSSSSNVTLQHSLHCHCSDCIVARVSPPSPLLLLLAPAGVLCVVGTRSKQKAASSKQQALSAHVFFFDSSGASTYP